MDLHSYYRHPCVRARIIDALGASTLDASSALFLTDYDRPHHAELHIRHAHELEFYLDGHLDISRSLWDRKHLIAHLDVEYVNFDFHAEPYLDPHRAFALQHPCETAIETVLLRYGISPRHFLSGRGHHFAWAINRHSEVFYRLASLGHFSEEQKQYYAHHVAPGGEKIDPSLGAAFAGLSQVMEFVAREALRRARRKTPIPVELSAIAVEPRERGREMVSLDISEYGDPLNTRLFRLPYTVYLKPWRRWGDLGPDLQARIPHMVMIPLFEMSIHEGVDVMRSLKRSAALASRAPGSLLDQTRETHALLDAYERSPAARFHRFYYQKEHEPCWRWPETYDAIDLAALPDCVSFALAHPNDLLVQPAVIRMIVRALVALDWHPRTIAGLLRSKYERDYAWGNEWYFYHAATRADFYTRVFAAQILLGEDVCEDFSCEHYRGAGLRTHSGAPCWLHELRQELQHKQKNFHTRDGRNS